MNKFQLLVIALFGLFLSFTSGSQCLVDKDSTTGYSITTTVDFNNFTSGTTDLSSLQQLGFHVWTPGANDKKLMIFNTASPGTEKYLGSPNKECSTGGTGVGSGGEPGATFENCVPLGNGLIVSGNNDPHNIITNHNGGDITFTFPGQCIIQKFGYLNGTHSNVSISYQPVIKLFGKDDNHIIDITPPLGSENSHHIWNFSHIPNVKKLYLWSGSRYAVTFMQYKCPCEGNPPPPPGCGECKCECEYDHNCVDDENSLFKWF